jgi:hypothetical protein
MVITVSNFNEFKFLMSKKATSITAALERFGCTFLFLKKFNVLIYNELGI